MSGRVIIVFVVVAFAAAVELEQGHPPHHNGHHHHEVVPILLDPEVAPSSTSGKQPIQDAAAIQPPHPPHLHGHHHHEVVPILPDPEVPFSIPVEQHAQEEIVEDDQNYVKSQDEDEVEDETDISEIGLRGFLERKSIPAKCDALSLPKYSCYNCNSYLVCKPSGGKIKACSDPYAPYCNNGICSQVPSADCQNL